MYLTLCALVFLSAYLLNVFTITVGYHRGLAHGAVNLHPRLRRLVVVLGHQSETVSAVLPSGVLTVFNGAYAEGLATSLAAGINALPHGLDGAVVLLGDMPGVGPELVDALIGAWQPGMICVPTHRSRRGNPGPTRRAGR